MLRPRLLLAPRRHLREGVCTWKLSSCPRKSPWSALEHRVEVGSSRAACVRLPRLRGEERIPTPVPDSARRRPSRLSLGGGTCAQRPPPPHSPPRPPPPRRSPAPAPPQAKLAGLGDDCAAAATIAAARGKRVPDGRRAAAGSSAATERAFQLELPRASCLSQERTRGTMETESRAVSAWGPPGPARRAGGAGPCGAWKAVLWSRHFCSVGEDGGAARRGCVRGAGLGSRPPGGRVGSTGAAGRRETAGDPAREAQPAVPNERAGSPATPSRPKLRRPRRSPARPPCRGHILVAHGVWPSMLRPGELGKAGGDLYARPRAQAWAPHAPGPEPGPGPGPRGAPAVAW